jgi:repressor LexA
VKKTINDLEHLATLQDYYAQHRVLPSYTRLMSLLGFASKSGIKKVLERLEVAGNGMTLLGGEYGNAGRDLN